MNRHIRIFLAGVMLTAPIAITVGVIWWVGSALDGLVLAAVRAVAPKTPALPFHGFGVILVLVGIYLAGLLTRVWGFRWVLRLLERLFERLPIVRSIYESVRDILTLFGGESEKMGQAVRFKVPGLEGEMIGIRTSTSPRGSAGVPNRVSVYLPMSYQIGGFTVYVPADAVEPLDMSVEQALKIAATADAGKAAIPTATGAKPEQEKP